MSLSRPSVIKYLPSWIVFFFIWAFAQLPYKFLVLLGKGLGLLLKNILKSRYKVVIKNLKICFPELTDTELKQLAHENYKELGIMVTQTLKSFLGVNSFNDRDFEIRGQEHLQKCLDEQQGVLLVAGHFTALDVGGKLLCSKYPVAGMYRPHKHPLTEYVVTKSRLKYATHMFKRDELRSIVKHLRSGGVLWYAPDQDYRRGQSVFVDFFGHPASTITATHQLARMSGCKVMYFNVKRNERRPYYSLSLSPVMEDFPTKDAKSDTQRVNDEISAMVTDNKDQYLWIHKRFKTQPEGQSNPYK